MPLAVDKLNPQSTPEEVKAAISETIQQLVAEGKTKEEAAAQAFETAKAKVQGGQRSQSTPGINTVSRTPRRLTDPNATMGM